MGGTLKRKDNSDIFSSDDTELYSCLLQLCYLFFRERKIRRKMICPQHFHNIFITNPKWQVVTDYYCWGKKVILVLSSNLNQ